MPKFFSNYYAIFSACVVSVTCLHGIQVVEPRNPRHDRILSIDGSINERFLFYDYDPSGIAVNQDTLENAGRAIMVSPQHFITTTHTAGTHPNTITFIAKDKEQRTFAVDHYDLISDSSDLTLGTLDAPIVPTDGIAWYSVPRYTETGYIGANVGIFSMHQLAGINRIDSVSGDYLWHDYDDGSSDELGRGADEAMPTMGDSGHAMIAAYEGKIYALGVHTYTTGAHQLADYIDSINTFMIREGYQLDVVDRLPRTIADFNTAINALLWAEEGINGGLTIVSADTSENPVGRLGSQISHHHLYAETPSRRPLTQPGPTPLAGTVLRFNGAQGLYATDTDNGSAQAFMFELNTEQPRIYIATRLDIRDNGISTLLHIIYNEGEKELLLQYDHATDQIRLSGLALRNTIETPATEGEWLLVEAVWEQQNFGIAVNGRSTILADLPPGVSDNTDFDSLTIGAESDYNNGLYGEIGRIVFTDSGTVTNPSLTNELLTQFDLQRIKATTTANPPLLTRTPPNRFRIRLDLRSAQSPSDPFVKVPLDRNTVEVVNGKIVITLKPVSPNQEFYILKSAD